VTVYNPDKVPLLAFTDRGQFDIQLWRKTGMFNYLTTNAGSQACPGP
jgi:hypothetical protein